MEKPVFKEDELTEAYQIASDFVNGSYLNKLENHEVKEVPASIKELEIEETFRFFKVNKLVYDRKENNLDKLANIYSSLEDVGASLIMVIDSDGEKSKLYLGIKRTLANGSPTIAQEVLENSFNGNFPGSEIKNVNSDKIETLVEGITESNFNTMEKEISSVSGIPSLKDEDKEKFVQGLEKLIDAMQGEEFSAVFIADPVSREQIAEIKSGYEILYSQLSPFAENQLTFTIDKSLTFARGSTKGFTETINRSITQTHSYTENKSKTEGDLLSTIAGAGIGGLAGGPIGAIIGMQIMSNIAGQETEGSSYSESNSETTGVSRSESEQVSSSQSATKGLSKGMQINSENKKVTNFLAKIDEQLERLDTSKDFGMWNCAAYFLAEDNQTAKIAASTFKALMRGDNSSVEDAYINSWDNDNKDNLVKVKNYLKKFHHPLVDLNVNNKLDLPYVTPGSLLSGRELTIHFGLPVKSITGVTVMEAAEFGRNIITYDGNASKESISLGKIFHMGRAESTEVKIDIDSLVMHTFITGSTGSGKSNTIYKLLAELTRKRKKFLVIEPAKGEYKEVFGGREDVNVYGTNPKYTELFKINPFKFPEDIHVLEHIDRLIEIFNACWPMYAAMPAVLKEGVERAYEMKGWDLDNSICLNSDITYPGFRDVLKILPKLIEESAYSEEVKSNYLGALVTRIRSLTNGLTGRIFTENEIDKDKLFNENCIVDLSRIGSVETKSLLMGILFMRLHEVRYANASRANSKLKHVTVLEEAHNLLRKTSIEQNQESSNLQGKSVEMIANAIAEMRSYGEGFIIADQSPNILDQAVIKNTNTKIILRLPDEVDRQLVGKAAGLNEEQIIELAKLKTGVGAIYQNNWLDPVLCTIDEYQGGKPLEYSYDFEANLKQGEKMRTDLIKILFKPKINNQERFDLKKIDVEKIKEWLLGIDIEPQIKKDTIDNLVQYQEKGSMELWSPDKFDNLSRLVGELIDYSRLARFASSEMDYFKWTNKFKEGLRNYVNLSEHEKLEDYLVKHLLNEKAHRDAGFKDFYFTWIEKVERGL
ncbi:ATP-binding protein [Fuchsiella alkaliacetigena]|uniref:ATP-binding protein n=1 Tax=Fuchsiella alkaliacetigena TaxID=957042 RepID=UPI00200AA428|nr:ATP-binding protein [Fuchsiella alkaliacetigena]MCK8823443.1 ATP-binding protein [Fuchsiella alkaliacetigena]